MEQVIVGKIVNTHGIKGELKVKTSTDFIEERFAKGAHLYIDENGVKHLQGVCRGEVKNSVGAGDSMVAGFIAGYLSRLDYHETLKLATAAGGATAFSNGLATQAKIYELLKQL